jgi:arginase family enzyme
MPSPHHKIDLDQAGETILAPPGSSGQADRWPRSFGVRSPKPEDLMEIQSGGSLWGRVIDKVKACNGVLHLSFDVDFLDPDVAPGVGTTVPGGGTYREAHLIMELLNDSGLVHSLDIVELNPFLDNRGRTARNVVELIGSLFGQQITDRPTPTNAI